MTIDLKYLIPALAPFGIIFIIKAVWWAAGAQITEPALLGFVSLAFGALLGGTAVMVMVDAKIRWNVRLWGKEKLAAAHEIEAARQALCRQEATPRTLAYARFLLAVESDATYSGGSFGNFVAPPDDELLRRYPFFAGLIGEDSDQ